MTALKVVTFSGGALLVGVTLLSAVKTVVLPRAAPSMITGSVFRSSLALFRLMARPTRAYEDRDRVMALFAPITLLVLPVVWLLLVGVGYTAMFWASGYGSVAESWGASGSSLLTLGMVPLSSAGHRALGFSAAAIGLILIALLITFLPSMYGSFARRERRVALLEVRAGSPPSAVEMLLRFQRIGWTQDLDNSWDGWEGWFADLEESHTSFPALNFFRSSQPAHSWVNAAGVVLDSAALWHSSCEHPPDPRAAVCIRAGYIALRRIAGFFSVPYSSLPNPSDPISITRSEFDEAFDRLAAGGVAMKPDRDQAWLDFAGWRVNYDSVLLALAELTVAPYAPWVSDRSPVAEMRSPFLRRL